MAEPLRCTEHVWRASRGLLGERSGQCGNKAKYAARMPTETVWNPVCGVTAHLERWTTLADADVIDLVDGQLPADPEAAALEWRTWVAGIWAANHTGSHPSRGRDVH